VGDSPDFSGLKFDDKGLVPAIVQDAATGEILMMAWMNAESLARTLDRGTTWFWSRSRKETAGIQSFAGREGDWLSSFFDCFLAH